MAAIVFAPMRAYWFIIASQFAATPRSSSSDFACSAITLIPAGSRMARSMSLSPKSKSVMTAVRDTAAQSPSHICTGRIGELVGVAVELDNIAEGVFAIDHA